MPISTTLYEITDPPNSITIGTFTSSTTHCDSFAYTLTYSDNSAIDPTIFNFDTNTVSLDFFTNDLTKQKQYDFKLSVDLPGWYALREIFSV